MILIGHKLVPYTPLYKVSTVKDIKATKPNSIVLFDFSDEELLHYCKDNELIFSLHVKNLTEACIANALGAKFILVDEKLAIQVQNVANEYLFDSKIILHIKDEFQIEKAIKDSIDGIIFTSAII
jgi:hypothetical protein